MPAYSPGIREYDGFVAHQMLRRLAGIDGQLDAARERDRLVHLDLVIECLQRKDDSSPPSLCSAYVTQLRAGKRPGRLNVMHDLGLDPQNDDWIAIQILRTVW